MKAGKRRWAALRYRQKIRNTLLAYYLTPILLIVLVSGVSFYVMARRGLDQEFGKRLESIARSAAYQVHGYQVAALELRDPQSLTYQSILARLDRIRAESDVSKIYVFNELNESLLDTDSSAAIGAVYERNRMNLAELDRARRGEPAASVLFRGKDGRFYKSAFAPILDGSRVAGIVGVDGSATFFESLRLLGRRMALLGLVCAGIVVLVSMVISRKIVTPIQTLVTSAQRIGEGHLDDPVEVRAQNELGFLAFAMDDMRKSMVARDCEMQMMLRGIAHEVRNPLGGIELFAGMLGEEPIPESAREAVRRIQDEIRNLKNLVEEFLDFARGPSLQATRVELGDFLADLRVSHQRELAERKIDCHVKVDGVDAAEFDPDQMRRVFLNLMRNAIQAMPAGGKLEIGARRQNGHIELFVTDTGAGISQEDADRIFDPFFTTKEHGTGLGLSFVRKIVSAHGGDVRVESAPGEGTTMSILLSA